MNIQAVTETPALNSAIAANAKILASIGLDRPASGKIPASELEAKMAKAGLPAVKRIELKRALDKMVDWNR